MGHKILRIALYRQLWTLTYSWPLANGKFVCPTEITPIALGKIMWAIPWKKERKRENEDKCFWIFVKIVFTQHATMCFLSSLLLAVYCVASSFVFLEGKKDFWVWKKKRKSFSSKGPKEVALGHANEKQLAATTIANLTNLQCLLILD